jgi:hypothetical protein
MPRAPVARGAPNMRTNVHHPDAVLTRMLSESRIVRIVLDATRSGVIVPMDMRHEKTLALQLGLNLANPIADLVVNSEWIECTLSFGGRPIFCLLPWSAVLGMIAEDTQEVCVLEKVLPPPPAAPPPAPVAAVAPAGAGTIDLMSRRTPQDRAAVRRRLARRGIFI